MRGRISVTGIDAANRRNKKLIFKNNAPFRLCKPRIDSTFIDNAEDPLYNLLQYSGNFSRTTGSLWNYYRDEVNDHVNENNDAGNYNIYNNKTTTSKSFKYKAKIIGNT